MRAALLARRTSRTLLAATYLLAFFAPSPVLSVPATVALSADTPYVDYSVTLDGETLFYVTASSGRDCAGWDFAQHVDPYLILFNDAGELARDDDGNFNEVGDCYSAKLNLTPAAGTYTLRVTSYQHETNQTTIPSGSVTLAWSQDGYQPPTTTTTTTSTTTTSTTTTTTSSTTTSTTTSSTTTTTAPPTTTSTTTTTTQGPASTTSTSTSTTTPAPPTTTTTTSTTLPPATTTSSTTLPPPATTLPPTTTTRPPATTTSTTTSSTTSTTSTTTTSTTTTTTAPPTTTTATPTTTQAPPTTTEPPRLTEALTVAAAIADEALAAAVVDVIAAEPDEIAVEDVQELVEQPSFDELEPVQLAAVAAAINDAPVEAKEVFEDAAADDMFSAALADYTRSDSRISQEDRRTVVAVTAAGAVLAVPRSATPIPSPTGSPARRNQT